MMLSNFILHAHQDSYAVKIFLCCQNILMLSKYSYSVNMIWPKVFHAPCTSLPLIIPHNCCHKMNLKMMMIHCACRAQSAPNCGTWHFILLMHHRTISHMILPLPKDIIWSSYPFSRKYVKTCLGLWDLRRFEDLQVFHLGLNYLWSKVLRSPTEGPRSVSDHLKKKWVSV